MRSTWARRRSPYCTTALMTSCAPFLSAPLVDRSGRAVARLEPTLQETVALHYFQDLSLREVGVVLGSERQRPDRKRVVGERAAHTDPGRFRHVAGGLDRREHVVRRPDGRVAVVVG